MEFELSTESLGTRERILAIAMEQFFSMEYSKVTLKGIAALAGVTKGGIYHYFESKDHLLAEAITYSLEAIMTGIDHTLSDATTVKATIKNWFDFNKMMGDYSQVFSGEDGSDMMMQFMYLLLLAIRKFPEMGTKFSEIYERSLKVLSAILVRGQENGEIRADINPDAVALQITTSFEGAALIGHIMKDRDMDQIGTTLFESFWNQIKAN